MGVKHSKSYPSYRFFNQTFPNVLNGSPHKTTYWYLKYQNLLTLWPMGSKRPIEPEYWTNLTQMGVIGVNVFMSVH